MSQIRQCRTPVSSIYITSFQFIPPRERLQFERLKPRLIGKWGTAGEKKKKSAFHHAICGWVMTSAENWLIYHYKTLAFWLWRQREKKEKKRLMGGWLLGTESKNPAWTMKWQMRTFAKMEKQSVGIERQEALRRKLYLPGVVVMGPLRDKLAQQAARSDLNSGILLHPLLINFK